MCFKFFFLRIAQSLEFVRVTTSLAKFPVPETSPSKQTHSPAGKPIKLRPSVGVFGVQPPQHELQSPPAAMVCGVDSGRASRASEPARDQREAGGAAEPRWQ